MRQRKRHVKELRRSHTGSSEHRNVIAVAVTAVAAGLCAYFLPSSHATSLYASSGAESDSFKALATGSACANPVVIPMDPNNAQSGVTKGNYYITNDTWNAAHYMGLVQALYVCNYNSWFAIANMNNDLNDGAVKTSPNVQETWYPTPTKLSSWESITSQFSDMSPGTGSNYGIWEFEYDIWLNGLADSNSTEVMIWTYNNGQTPRGSASGSFTDADHTYEVYHSSPPYQYVAFVDRSNNLSGNVNLLDFFNYVISRGWMPRSSTLYQICNGAELVSTNNRSEKFAINNFSINMKAYGAQPRLYFREVSNIHGFGPWHITDRLKCNPTMFIACIDEHISPTPEKRYPSGRPACTPGNLEFGFRRPGLSLERYRKVPGTRALPAAAVRVG